MKRRRKPTLISSFNGYFPAEIWDEVLARLPSKSLLRFRCVCKSWLDLIDSPQFVSLHMNLHKLDDNKLPYGISTFHYGPHHRLIFTTRDGETFRRLSQLQPIELPTCCKPLANVDGLVLLLSSNYNPRLSLWNPSIRKSLILPRCPLSYYLNNVFAVGLAPSINEYKVVGLQFYPTQNSGPSFAVLQLGDGSWRRSSKGMDHVLHSTPPSRLQHNSISTKGANHRLISYTSKTYTHVASFDFDAEEVSFLQLPQHGGGGEGGGDVVWSLFLLGELVAVLEISTGSSCIWVMDKGRGKEPWTKWYSGDSSDAVYTCFKYWPSSAYQFILFLKKSGVFFINVDGNLMTYNIRSHQIRRLAISIRSLHYMYPHVETLLFHKGYKAQNCEIFLQEEANG